MPRSKDVSAIFHKFITHFRAILDKEVNQAVARASREVRKGKKKVKALAKKARQTSRKLRRGRPRLAKQLKALAGFPRPGYSKYGKKLGRPAKGKV